MFSTSTHVEWLSSRMCIRTFFAERKCIGSTPSPIKKGEQIMGMLPLTDRLVQSSTTHPTIVERNSQRLLREQVHGKKVVNAILLVIVLLQLIELPGALLMKSAASIGTVVLGLVLCAMALVFNQMGKVTMVSILLITVVDLGCGLMLLTTPMGLGVSDLPTFDLLVVSELIAVSLLPPISVFPVALSNIVFIAADLLFQQRTSELQMVLTSSMGFNAIAQPISLQIVVAVVSYIWVRNALRAMARADRAEEIAELQQREAERQRHLDAAVQHLSQVLVQAANGDRTVRAQLNQDNMLWRVGNSLNLLLTRLMRIGQVEQENKQLRAELTRVTEARHLERIRAQAYASPQQAGPYEKSRRQEA